MTRYWLLCALVLPALSLLAIFATVFGTSLFLPLPLTVPALGFAWFFALAREPALLERPERRGRLLAAGLALTAAVTVVAGVAIGFALLVSACGDGGC